MNTQNNRFLEFGDFVDPTFNCPATTTCYLVCVETTADCPSDATSASASAGLDPSHEYELCKDGNCADLTLGESCDPSLESPCTCAGITFTCPKQVDLYDSCHARFQEYFTAHSTCLEEESESLNQLEFLPVRSKLLYIPIIVITSLTILWSPSKAA